MSKRFEKCNLVIARRITNIYYQGYDEEIKVISSLSDFQPICYIGKKGDMECSGRVKEFETHEQCKKCPYWKDYKVR